MTTAKKGDDPEPDPYTQLNSIEAFYMGDTAGAANYILKFATALDDYDRWSNVYFGLWTSEIPQDYDNIILPNGSFTANTDRSAGTFEPEYTFSRTYPNETIVTFTGGTITVAAEGDTFTITADLTDGQGNPYQYRYIGKVRVSDESPHHLPKITSNVDASFYLAEGTYFGDYYKNGTSLIDIGFTSADVFMSVEFLSEGSEKFSADVLKPGTYTINADRSQYTLTPGEEYNKAGWEYLPVGTYCRVIGNTDTYGFATAGTVTVEKSGSQYTLAFDLTTPEGKMIKGNYSGTLTLTDGTEQPVLSQLEEDRVVDLSHIESGRMVYSGTWYNNGMNNWTIYVKDESIDNIDGMIFDFNMPDEGFLPEGIPTGSYELSSVAKENTMVPGFINTYLAGTWYIWANAGGSYGKAAPIKTGSLTIGKEGDIWTLDFEMYDDARPAHMISGSWSGPIRVVNEWD